MTCAPFMAERPYGIKVPVPVAAQTVNAKKEKQ